MIIMINGSKISVHCFNATTLFHNYGQRMTTLITEAISMTLILPDECGHSLTIQNSVVTLNDELKFWYHLSL